MAGLQGSGKTTACAKLARCLREQNKLVGRRRRLRRLPPGRRRAARQGRRRRPAPTSTSRAPTRDPVEIAGWALDQAKRDGKDVLIVDTAGRLHIDEELMDELANDQASASSRTTCCSSSTR